MCQLFRPGRLTPIYFGHFNDQILHRICQYYFRQSHPLSGKIDLQPSAVIDLVVKSLLETDNQQQRYESFCQRLITLQKNTT